MYIPNSTARGLVAVGALLGDHPGEQVDFGNDSGGACLAIGLLGDDSGRIPFEELVEVAELGVACDLNKLPPAADLSALAVHLQPAEILDDLIELAEVEHDVLNLRLRCRAARRNVGEQIAQCDQTYEPLLAGTGVDGDGELVEALLAHCLDGFAAGRIRGDGRDGPKAQRGDGGAVEGIVLVVLAEREAAGDVRGLRCVRRGLGEEVIGGKPVVIDKLSDVSTRYPQ